MPQLMRCSIGAMQIVAAALMELKILLMNGQADAMAHVMARLSQCTS
jgi:hypothetical protein